jgi:hypothetical protein
MAMNQDVSTLLHEGIAAAKRGDKATASDRLQQVVELDERNEQAWLWLSGVVDSQEDIQICLENVLEINPNNTRAAAGLRWLQQQQAATPTPTPPQDGGGGASPPLTLPQDGGGSKDLASPLTPLPDQPATANPFAQPAASPFAPTPAPLSQQPPASPFRSPAMAASSDGPQYLPFNQAAPPREMAAPPPPPSPPPAEPEANPFANRPASSGLASRLNSGAVADSSDLDALRSTLFGGAPASPPDANHPDGELNPAPPALEGNPLAVPAANNPYPDVAPPNPFAAPDDSNPFATLVAPDRSNPFAVPPANGNPYGINSELRPSGMQSLHEPETNGMQDGNSSASFSLQAPPATSADEFPAVNPFEPPLEARPPLFAPRPPLGDTPPRPAGLAGRAGLADLMSSSAGPLLVPPDEETLPPSSPILIARPPLTGGRPAPTDVATFPCPNCRKLVAENSLSCPFCSFQFYARCPNCSEYVDTTAPSNPHGDHCPNCGVAINLMELGRAGSVASAASVQSGSIRPRSTAAMGEGMTLMTPVKGLVEPTAKPRRSSGRLIYQLFVLLLLIAIVIFLLWAKDNLKLTDSTSHTQVIPATVLSGIAGNGRAVSVASDRLGNAVTHLDGPNTLAAVVAAQDDLHAASARLSSDLDLAAASLAPALQSGPGAAWYAQYLDKERAYIGLHRDNLARYQQALNKSAPLWAFLSRYYAWLQTSDFDLSSLGASQAVSNSAADSDLRDELLAQQRDATSLGREARQAAAATACPSLDDLAAELDRIAQFYGLRAAVLADLLNGDPSRAQQDTIAVQTLVAEMKAQAFYHPSLLDAATLSDALRGWYATAVASIYDRAASIQDEASQLHEAAQRQLAARLADDAPLVPADAAAAYPAHPVAPVQRGDN